MNNSNVSCSEFLDAARQFAKISNEINDGWEFVEKSEVHKSFLIKKSFKQTLNKNSDILLRTEYVIFYNMSYGVPSFSFNIWNSSGVLLTLEYIRRMAFLNINEKDFYSVITQQEHPLFQRPYFIVHPCHTDTLLAAFKNNTKNIITTFLGLITPLIKIDLPLEYGL